MESLILYFFLGLVALGLLIQFGWVLGVLLRLLWIPVSLFLGILIELFSYCFSKNDEPWLLPYPQPGVLENIWYEMKGRFVAAFPPHILRHLVIQDDVKDDSTRDE